LIASLGLLHPQILSLEVVLFKGGRSAPDTDIAEGAWDVLMFHHDCHKCQEVVPVQRAHAAANPSTRLLLLEVPPCGPPPAASPNVTVARLDDSHSWFVSAPVMVRVENGVVTSVTTDFD